MCKSLTFVDWLYLTSHCALTAFHVTNVAVKEMVTWMSDNLPVISVTKWVCSPSSPVTKWAHRHYPGDVYHEAVVAVVPVVPVVAVVEPSHLRCCGWTDAGLGAVVQLGTARQRNINPRKEGRLARQEQTQPSRLLRRSHASHQLGTDQQEMHRLVRTPYLMN